MVDFSKLLDQDTPSLAGVSLDTHILLSIAISLRRIADAMQQPNEYGEVGGAAIAGAISRSLRDAR